MTISQSMQSPIQHGWVEFDTNQDYEQVRSTNLSKVPSRKVWSSESGDLRKEPSRPAPGVQSQPRRQQVIALHRDSKGRAGKGVTVLRGLTLTEAELSTLAKTLKQSLGLGGTVKNGVVEIQSQEREKIAEVLIKLGYRVKIAGG